MTEDLGTPPTVNHVQGYLESVSDILVHDPAANTFHKISPNSLISSMLSCGRLMGNVENLQIDSHQGICLINVMHVNLMGIMQQNAWILKYMHTNKKLCDQIGAAWVDQKEAEKHVKMAQAYVESSGISVNQIHAELNLGLAEMLCRGDDLY